MKQDPTKPLLPKLLWLAAFCWAAASSHAQGNLPEEVSAALGAAQIDETSFSAVVLPIRGGAPRLAHFEQRAMAPASTMKLVTTLVALEELGPVFRWQTQLLTQASLKGSTLRGPLYLRGGGDPNLNWDSLRAMFRSLRSQGVRRLDGDLILDRSFFRPTRLDVGAPAFDESPDAYYNVIPDALLLNGNLIEFELESGAKQTAVRTLPPLDRFRIDAALTLNDSNCEAWDDNWDKPQIQTRADGSTTLLLRGAFPRNCKTKTRLSLLDRNLYIERFVRAFWKELGGSWKGKAADGLTPPEARLLVERASSTLADAVRPINKTSDNAMTRTLYLTLGTRLPTEGRSDNTSTNAAAAVQNWFFRHGIADDGLVLDNGSGLSRLERISPRQLAALLQVGAGSNWFAEFASSFPIVATDSAMRKRLTESPAAGRARIKTGTLRDATAVAGYVRDKDNQDWVVVAIINHPDAKKGRPALDAVIHWAAKGLNAP
jgi:D-alanyl-D-alanine carboxypeptidase/D-alanyl-D-alanine-endopeptidase (penicillin-binding protein 4)